MDITSKWIIIIGIYWSAYLKKKIVLNFLFGKRNTKKIK